MSCFVEEIEGMVVDGEEEAENGVRSFEGAPSSGSHKATQSKLSVLRASSPGGGGATIVTRFKQKVFALGHASVRVRAESSGGAEEPRIFHAGLGRTVVTGGRVIGWRGLGVGSVVSDEFDGDHGEEGEEEAEGGVEVGDGDEDRWSREKRIPCFA